MTFFVAWNRKHRDYFFFSLIFLWTVGHLYLSGHRSMWQDELTRYGQMQMPLLAALKSLFQEPSPFTPGEIILGFLSKGLFGSFSEFEFWGRVPSVLWGTATLLLAYRMQRFILFLLLFFSVSLTSFCTQFRPYAALIFDGALAVYILDATVRYSWKEKLIFALSVVFGHLYGIVFIGFAFFLRRKFLATLLCVLYLALVTACFYIAHQNSLIVWTVKPNTIDFRSYLGWLSKTFGSPYGELKLVLFVLPIIGFLFSCTKNLSRTLQHGLLFFVTLALPFLANLIGNYAFVPRQVVGALFSFYYFVDLGISCAVEPAPARPTPQTYFRKAIHYGRPVLWALILLFWAGAWKGYVFEGKPPFAEQPLHKYFDVAKQTLLEKDRNVLLIDPGGMGYHYFLRTYGEKIEVHKEQHAGHEWVVRCWPEKNFCLYHFDESEYAWKDLNEIAELKEFRDFALGQNPSFQRIIYNSFEFRFPRDTAVKLNRAW